MLTHRSRTPFPLLSASALLSVLAACAGHRTREPAPPPAEHAKHGEAHWSYSGDTGPAHWGGTCQSGEQQSPIDLRGASPRNLPNINFSYNAFPLALVNNGHTVQANAAPGSHITVAGHEYALAQFHFHAPSEHTVEGRSFPLEMHLVHKDATGRLAVIGVLFERGQPMAALARLFASLPATAGERTAPSGETIDPAAILPANRVYFTYAGSLTTPGCDEAVQWFVLQQPVAISAEQIESFTRLYPDNHRPVQPLGRRSIILDSTP